MRGKYRELILVTPPGPLILVGRSIAPELAELRRAAWMLTSVGGMILLIGLAGGWWLASRAIRPIDDISAAAARIADGDLSQRISTADTESELGQLTAVLNSTFTRLENAFVRQQQFTADAAHELRTPVSVILTQTQGTLKKERSAADYRETLEACQRAAQRMRRLIESLLQLARIDDGAETLPRENIDLARVAADCAELVRPLAAEHDICINTEFFTAECLGNSDQLALAITNLLTNAIHHNQPGGEVSLTTRTEANRVILTVRDNGPGVAEEHLPHLFERFYRADAARSTHTGGAGLGLAIVKASVDACGGSVSCRNLQPRGFEVEIIFPRNP
jgi:heavy metal sensor kinase